ncbi:MAG: glucose-1-phosphate thymidylyltransferase [Actinobacteria bacterium]|nr:glucose-1-phosphate thymidylyltransferase [Actinomycetota bacterium]
MKALVLAGGEGTRLRPITHTSAKQLVPVANRPILDFGLEAIRDAGITDVGIIVGGTHAEIEAHVGDGARFGIRVTYLHQPAPLGLAHAVLTAADWLADDDFVMYLGDNLIADGITQFVRQFRERRPTAQILLARVRDPERFGVAELDDTGHVVRLVEKPQHPPSDLALVGVYLFSSRITEAARSIAPSQRGELEITDAIQWLIEHDEPVASQIVTGWWKDTGKLDDLLEANRIILDTIDRRVDGDVDADSDVQGRVVIEKGARIVDSSVRGPAVIDSDTTLTRTFVGPYTSIGAGCTIVGSELEHSVVLDGVTIQDIGRMEDSLVGRQAHVVRSERRPRAHRFMLGDHSRVDLP